MAINFPTSLDVFTDPTASDQLNLPSHSGQHTDLNNAVEALEAKVGADSSAVTSSHDYKIAQLEAQGTWTAFTPSWNANMTVGNATQEWYYLVVNDLLHVTGVIVLGSTSSISGFIEFDNPFGTMKTPNGIMCGVTECDGKLGGFQANNFGGANKFRITVGSVSGSYLATANISSTVPTTWTTGDQIRAAGTVALA